MRHLHEHNLTIERRLGDAARARLPGVVGEFVMFVFKQAWACLFGGLLLAMIIGTKLVWNPDWALQRYDFLFLFAIITQALFLRFKLETWEEARVILLFHLTGTAMEWFKVHAGSWGYPEPGLFKLMGVPLFSGFMYAAVGSYIARVIRIFSMRFAPYPAFWMTMILAVAIYVNFFSHHFLPDIRLALLTPLSGSSTPKSRAGCLCRLPPCWPVLPSGRRKISERLREHGCTPVNCPEKSSVLPS